MNQKNLGNFVYILAFAVIGFMGLSCGSPFDIGNPEVYLVEDSSSEFHLQWTEPLEEERIVLMSFFNPRKNENWYYLLHFPVGSWRSELFGERWTIYQEVAGEYHNPENQATASVEILSDGERSKVKLPAHANNTTEEGESIELFVGHPFKPYNVGKPSKLNFSLAPWEAFWVNGASRSVDLF